MRCVENHDNPRIMALAPEEISAKAWTAFEIFNQGAFLIYAGQESGALHTPSLFDIDKINWGDYRLQSWLQELLSIKKRDNFQYGHLSFLSADPAIQAVYSGGDSNLLGIFNVNNHCEPISIQLSDGEYADLITGKSFIVNQGLIDITGSSVLIFEIFDKFGFEKLEFDLLKYRIS
jgi:hypothetical protein